MQLTAKQVAAAKGAVKAFRLYDERGMYLQVNPNGSKLWRYKYRFGGKEQLLSIGQYPDVSLAVARERRDEARKLVAVGVSPAIHKRLEKQKQLQSAANSFQAVAIEWLAKVKPTLSADYYNIVERRLDRDIYPWMGKRPISEITAAEVLVVLHRIVKRGAVETAHRARINCSMVFRHAVQTDRLVRDPTADLKGALPNVKEVGFAAIIEPSEIGALLRAVDGYVGTSITACALKLAPLVFVRPGELRSAEWSEFDIHNAEWKIPSVKMKRRVAHIVPLAPQALEILAVIKPITGQGKYVFPSERSKDRCMSENTLLGALRRLGYSKEEMTAHGFRKTASTRLHEAGYQHAWIEIQLAHGMKDKVAAAYDYAEYLPERRKMMREWANYLDDLREGKTDSKALQYTA